MKHTKGKWEVAEDDNTMVIVRKLNEVVEVHSGSNIYSDEEAKANASLIASAPCLLEACKDSLKAIKTLPIDSLGVSTYTESNGEQVSYPLRDELIGSINKAITNAEGKV